MVGVEKRAKYKRTAGADFGPVDVVKYAEASCAKGLIHAKSAKLRGQPELQFARKSALTPPTA